MKKPEHRRYRMVLEASIHTSSMYHGAIVASADKLVDLLPNVGRSWLRPSREQPWHVLDAKKNVKLSPEELYGVLEKIQAKS
jgi:hypothetical protein